MYFKYYIIERRSAAATQPGKSDSCIALVQELLPLALARPYVEQYLPEGTRVRQPHNALFDII